MPRALGLEIAEVRDLTGGKVEPRYLIELHSERDPRRRSDLEHGIGQLERAYRQSRAVGGNEQATRLAGIPVDRIKLITYTFSGFCAALGAIIFTARVTVGDPWAGRGLELDAIAAVVIGGTSLFGGIGSVWGTFLGTLIIIIRRP